MWYGRAEEGNAQNRRPARIQHRQFIHYAAAAAQREARLFSDPDLRLPPSLLQSRPPLFPSLSSSSSSASVCSSSNCRSSPHSIDPSDDCAHHKPLLQQYHLPLASRSCEGIQSSCPRLAIA